MTRIAIIGTQGVPARYGGFETLVENLLGENCPPAIEYTVFCSSKDYETQLSAYRGAKLIYIPVHANGVQSTWYDIRSMVKAIGKFDVAVILGVSGCIFLPIFRLFFRGRIVVNIDGLEHRRAKWGRVARNFLRLSEAVAVRFADAVIADNQGILDYVRKTYRKEAALIAYGGDHVLMELTAEEETEILDRYGLFAGNYFLAICRIEPENNCHLILEGFARNGQPLIFIGNWDRSEYGKELAERYSGSENIRIQPAVYDLKDLYALRKRCRGYIHGHSAGGTNPSLVEAMFFGVPVFAFDVVYNRETTENCARYFSTPESLFVLVEELAEEEALRNGAAMAEISRRRYTWKRIAEQYVKLAIDN